MVGAHQLSTFVSRLITAGLSPFIFAFLYEILRNPPSICSSLNQKPVDFSLVGSARDPNGDTYW